MAVENVISKLEEYSPGSSGDLLFRAYDFALHAHDGQTRQSGEPYIQHPLEVADILAVLEMDPATIAAGLLHDVVEDTKISLEDLRKEFGDEVTSLVDGLTKLTLMDFQAGDVRAFEGVGGGKKRRELELKRQAENLRKILLAMAHDIRVMIIKLADRLHNMRTLGCCSPEKQRRVALETMQIYAPLAHRLGIWTMKWQLEDLAFKYLEPEKFNEVAEKVARTRLDREADIGTVIQTLKDRLKDAGIDATIQGRPKHLWSIYNKMLQQEIDFEEIYDLTAVRVIVHTVAECYHALGIVHDQWMPIAGMFSDYIAKPKPNMYQSLHTKVVGPRSEPLEIQIRTFEMHRTADFGVAAHWRYKEGSREEVYDQKLGWLRRQMFDWSSENSDSGDFLRSVTQDLFTDQVFVFTPRGEVFDLPAGSTPVDFAYRVHSQVGDTCVGARINGRIVPLSTALRNGDVVDILTRTGSKPSFDWLSYVKSSHARTKIRAYFRRQRHAENMARGREFLEKEAVRQGLDPKSTLSESELERIAPVFKMHTIPDLLAAVGSGSLGATTIITRLKEDRTPPDPSLPVGSAAKEGKLNITPGGVDQVLIKRSQCCQPLPGDSVVGYVSRGRGMILHQEDCRNLEAYRQKEAERLVPVEWDPRDGEVYSSSIKIEAFNRVGLLSDISAIFSEAKVNISSATVIADRSKTTQLKRTRTELPAKANGNEIATFDINVDVHDTGQLSNLMTTLRSRVSDVLDVYRISNSSSMEERRAARQASLATVS